MKFTLMRFLDKYVGKGLIYLLLIYHLVRSLLPSRNKDEIIKNPQNILILKFFFGIGSIMNAIPLFETLKSNYPEAKLTLVTFSSNKGLTEFTTQLDSVLTVRQDTFVHFFYR